MKTFEITLPVQGFTMSANIYPARSHYRFIMSLGHVFPTTKSQAQLFISKSNGFDVLNMDDVMLIDALMIKHSLVADFKYTKSKHWVRLQNVDDFKKALKLEYLIK